MAASGNPADCNDTMRQRMGDEFVRNLPGHYHSEMYRAEYYYDRYARYVFGGGDTSQFNYWGGGTMSYTTRWDEANTTLYVTDTSTIGRNEDPLLSHQNLNSASNSRVNNITGANSNAATNPTRLNRYSGLRCPPTGQQLLRNPKVKTAIEGAKRRANFGHPDKNMRREAGVWVFYNPVTGKVGTADVPTNQTGYDWTDFSNPPLWGRRVMIADIHVHPTLRSQEGHPGWSMRKRNNSTKEFRELL